MLLRSIIDKSREKKPSLLWSILQNDCSFQIHVLSHLTDYKLFNGDFVDRGSFSVEVILTLFGFKLLYPDHFFMARGECITIYFLIFVHQLIWSLLYH